MITVRRSNHSDTRHDLIIRDHDLTVDLAPSEGGADDGPDPHDLYDASLAACKALTMLWYAQRNAIPLEDIEVSITRDNSAERKGIYRLKAAVSVSGPMTDAQRDTLLSVAAKCPVHKLMTSVTTEIETVWRDESSVAS
jgi:putative redox protein